MSLEGFKLVAGLGNPGSRYARTRHNAGFATLDHLAWLNGLDFNRLECDAAVASGWIRGQQVILAKPGLYMNRSGGPVLGLKERYQLFDKDILVVCDDVALEMGRLRFRGSGRSGGHRGLEDITVALKSDEFTRLRIGVGIPPADGDLAEFVLEEFTAPDWPVFQCALIHATLGVERWLEQGLDFCMNVFNRK